MKNSSKIVLIVFLIIGFISCDYIIRNKDASKSKEQTIINNKIEAFLLAEATKKNVNIIALCDEAEQISSNKRTIKAVKAIKKQQLQILENLQTIARENMILVKKTANEAIVSEIVNKKDSILKNHIIVEIKENLDTQKEVLDSLVEKSNNEDILLVAEESIERLKSNIAITSYTLERLK